jgi:hypothetical protein
MCACTDDHFSESGARKEASPIPVTPEKDWLKQTILRCTNKAVK